MSKKKFDQLPPKVHKIVQKCAQQGYLADGSLLPLFGVAHLTSRLRSIPIDADFMVSRISKDAILGIPFLEAKGCFMNFGEATLSLENQKLVCNDRQGKRLRTHI